MQALLLAVATALSNEPLIDVDAEMREAQHEPASIWSEPSEPPKSDRTVTAGIAMIALGVSMLPISLIMFGLTAATCSKGAICDGIALGRGRARRDVRTDQRHRRVLS